MGQKISSALQHFHASSEIFYEKLEHSEFLVPPTLFQSNGKLSDVDSESLHVVSRNLVLMTENLTETFISCLSVRAY